MSNENRNEGTQPVNEAHSDFRPGSDDEEMVQLLTRLGVSDSGLFLSNERIAEIADSDADEEKRQLAARLLELQLYAKSITAIHTLNFKHTPGGTTS